MVPETSISSGSSPARPQVRLGILVGGLIASLVLVLLSGLVSTFEVSRAQRQVVGLFIEGERTTYLVGHIGKQLARTHLMLREVMTEGPARLESAQRTVPELMAEVSAAATELPALLSPYERSLWSELEPEIERLGREFVQSLHALERGDVTTADRILDGVVPLTVTVYDRLTQLSLQNRDEIADLIDRAEHRLAVVRWLEWLTGGIVLVGIIIAWMYAIRTLRRQAHQLDFYMSTVETTRDDLDAFAGRIAHDLRNTFGPLSMAAGALKHAPTHQAVEAIGERLQRASARAMALLDGLLAFSRAAKPKGEGDISSLGNEVQACVEELGPLAERMDATVHVELEDDPVVDIPGALLHMIIANLLNNALKFLEGCGRREVWITARHEKGTCLLIVEDTGPGIPAESLPRLFEPFYRVPGALAPGTGLGLATVKRILDAHAGGINVTSTPGKGTRFEISVPTVPSERAMAI